MTTYYGHITVAHLVTRHYYFLSSSTLRWINPFCLQLLGTWPHILL